MTPESQLEHFERLIRVEEKLTSLHDDLSAIKVLDTRVSALERWRAWVLGGMAALGGSLGSGVTWLMTHLSKGNP